MNGANLGRLLGVLFQKAKSPVEVTSAILDVAGGLAFAALGAGVLLDFIPHPRLNDLDRQMAWWFIVGGIAWALLHFYKKLLPRWRRRSFRLPHPRAVGAVLAGFASLLFLTGFYGGLTWVLPRGVHQKFWYPATLGDIGALPVLLAVVFVIACSRPDPFTQSPIAGGLPLPRRPIDGSENARYLAGGYGLLAVVAFALWRAQLDMMSVKSSLVRFFLMLPEHWQQLPPLHAVGLAILAVLAVIGVYRLVNGSKGPFPPMGLRGHGGTLWTVLFCFALWWWGWFLPPADDFNRGVNFNLACLYLFGIVNGTVTIYLLMGRIGGRGPGPVGVDIDRQKFRW